MRWARLMRCYHKFVVERVPACFKSGSLVKDMKILHVFLSKKLAAYDILSLGPVSFGSNIKWQVWKMNFIKKCWLFMIKLLMKLE